jgi:hypothetical protein
MPIFARILTVTLTPDQVYRTGDGGGAKIVDHFSEKKILQMKKWGSANLL